MNSSDNNQKQSSKSDFVFHILFIIARLILGVVFIYASIDKITHPQAFAQAVFNYQILPDFLVNPTALVLPWLELVLGCCILFNKWMAGAILIANILLVVFMSAIFYNLARGLDISCGCFSTAPSEDTINSLTIARDLFLLITAFFLLGMTFFVKPH